MIINYSFIILLNEFNGKWINKMKINDLDFYHSTLIEPDFRQKIKRKINFILFISEIYKFNFFRGEFFLFKGSEHKKRRNL